MSVRYLLAAASCAANARLAIVSAELFQDLFAAGEIDTSITSAHVPSDPKYKELMDDLLRSAGVDPDAPLPVPSYTLKRFPHIHVQQDAHHGLSLAPHGPASYQVR